MDETFVEIHASANPAEIGVVRSALATAGLRVQVKGDVTLGHRGCVIPARVLVSAADVAKARDVLRVVLGDPSRWN